MAAKMILSDPARYGFHFQEQDFYDAPDFDRITLTVAKDTPLADIAAAAGTYYKVIKDLNTQILGDDLVRGTHVLLLPQGSAKGFVARLQGVEAAPPSDSAPARGVDPSKKELRTYVVRSGDNVHAIARRLGVPLKALLLPNGLKPDSVIHPGQRLLVAE
jgi:LysM repeat protein